MTQLLSKTDFWGVINIIKNTVDMFLVENAIFNNNKNADLLISETF